MPNLDVGMAGCPKLSAPTLELRVDASRLNFGLGVDAPKLLIIIKIKIIITQVILFLILILLIIIKIKKIITQIILFFI